jgi:hypothetical protein
MQRVLRMLCATVIAGIVMSAVPAEASFWGWLERLSGPGPFEPTSTAIGLRGWCPAFLDLRQPANEAALATLFKRLPPRTHRGATCFYFDNASFVSRNDAFVGGTSDVNAKVFGAGITTLIFEWLELGVGMDVAHFRVERTKASVTRPTFTAGRVVVRPARIFCPERKCSVQKKKWRTLDVFKYYYKTDVIFGTLRSRDFGVAGNFREKGDAVSSRGILIDISEMFGRR